MEEIVDIGVQPDAETERDRGSGDGLETPADVVELAAPEPLASAEHETADGAVEAPGPLPDAPLDPAASEVLETPAGIPMPANDAELDRLHAVPVDVTAELGRTRMTIGEALALAPGSVVALNRMAGEPVDLLVNGHPIARGEVVVIDEEFGLRITELADGDA